MFTLVVSASKQCIWSTHTDDYPAVGSCCLTHLPPLSAWSSGADIGAEQAENRGSGSGVVRGVAKYGGVGEEYRAGCHRTGAER